MMNPATRPANNNDDVPTVIRTEFKTEPKKQIQK
jgi:hypothetical protein